MRKIGMLSSKEKLLELQNLLYFYEIKTSTLSDDDLVLWVVCDDDLSKACKIFQDFEKEVKNYSAEIKIGEEKKNSDEQIRKKDESRSLEVNVREIFSNSLFSNLEPVTFSILIFCSFLFLLQLLGFGNSVLRIFYFSNYISPMFYEIGNGQIWRLITPVFLHHDIIHILFNMIWLYQLGNIIEKKHSKAVYVSLICTVALTSNTIFYIFIGPSFLGFSGVIYGFIGFMWIRNELDPFCEARIDPGWPRFFGIWYVVCLVISLLGFPIANTIHGSGAFSGIVFGLILTFFRTENSKHFLKKIFAGDRFRTFLILIFFLVLGLCVDYSLALQRS